jgi:SAM-dependent methyltransferase
MARELVVSSVSSKGDSESTTSPYAANPVLPRLRLDQAGTRLETITHHVNRYKLAASYITRGCLALDVCCGTGYGTDILRQAGAGQAMGIDLSPDAIEYARSHYPECSFVQESVAHFLDGSNSPEPDVVTFFEAIEHLEQSVGLSILNSIQASLAHDGNFFVSTPRDIRADVNPDHITQWQFDELHGELTSRFEDVDIFGQDWATGRFSWANPESASFYVARCSQPTL